MPEPETNSPAPKRRPKRDRRAAPRPPRNDDLASPASQAVYRRVMKSLAAGGVDFLVGGAYAFTPYTGIERSTKDFDLFVRKTEIGRALDVLADAGYETELTFPHWLGKAYDGDDFVDLIFSSGNGVAAVDDEWFVHAPAGEVLGVPVRLAPAEEMVWSKSFVMERERYDGADVIHILRTRAEKLDWDRLLARFGDRWRVLLVNVVLFGFVYPGERTRVPRRVTDELLRRLHAELDAPADVGRLCNGTVVSRQQFLPDVLEWGYEDGRAMPHGAMTPAEIESWTEAIYTKK
ncbi:MAG: hypothetical protein AVDCRST_MAG11-3203 [uncultured Gemmatimonadaceae bacterium]|uniref:GYF domain-containing protein n=1 Tax=uncultured Gemmatimonadaceae bacterium TaxID=246130 RepID=A0A6J4M432_9BACT|nr:MAG: hypothetical protein AVDCRST_MAG11-3203 [uncultured Gemmatimonadaceae bacterium]